MFLHKNKLYQPLYQPHSFSFTMGKETTSPTPTTIIARPHAEENLHGEGTGGGSGGGGGCWCGWFRTRTNMFCELNTSGRKPDLADLATRDPSAGTWHDSIRLYLRVVLCCALMFPCPVPPPPYLYLQLIARVSSSSCFMIHICIQYRIVGRSLYTKEETRHDD